MMLELATSPYIATIADLPKLCLLHLSIDLNPQIGTHIREDSY